MTWTPINDFPGYEISMDGVVRSFRQRGRGSHRDLKRAHTITPVYLSDSNRWAVRLSKGGKRYMRCVANLVLETFLGPAPTGAGTGTNSADVVFKDGDPTNVTLSNLEWKTA